MKHQIYISLLLFLLLFGSPFTGKANVASGGNIEFEWIGDSTYRVIFKYLRACQSQTPRPDTLRLCGFNTCTNQMYHVPMLPVSGTITANNLPNGYVLPVTCNPATNKCNNSSGSFTSGVSEWWYSATITLPIRCNPWRFSVVAEVRTNNDNLAIRDTMCVESTIYFPSLVDVNHHSTPAFTNPAFFLACSGQLINYNNGAIARGGGVLRYSIVNPKTVPGCIVSTNSILATQIPPIQFPANATRSNTTFRIDSVTGTVTYTNVTGATQPTSLLTFLIEEFKGGQLITSTLRDVQVATINCTNPAPTINPIASTITGAVYTNNELRGCIGQTMQMCFDVKSTNINAILKVKDNHAQAIPPATTNYTNQGTNAVRGCFYWIPSIADTGHKSILLDVTDSTCTGGGFLVHYFILLKVYVAPEVVSNKDSTICLNEPALLKVKGGYGNYTWAVLPGGTAGSLSCINCDSTMANPQVSSRYVVSAPGAACIGNAYYYDTVKLDIHTAPTTTPVIKITASPGITVPPDSPVIFTANITGCKNPAYQWQKNGVNIAGATGANYTTNVLHDRVLITCSLSCADTCPMPRIQISDSIVMNITNSVLKLNNEQQIVIYPNPNNGRFIIETNGWLQEQNPANIEITNALGQVVHTGKLTENKQEIILNNHAAGIYFLKYVSTKETKTVRFIIQ